MVSVVRRPIAHADDTAWHGFVNAHVGDLFDPDWCKANFSCDAYFLDLDVGPGLVSEQSAYWFGLFSHQRDTFRWKGLVQVDLQCDDDGAMQTLAAIEAAGW